MEEQAATARDMASNTGQAASGLKDTASTMNQATDVSQNIATEMVTVHEATTELEGTSAQLRDQAASLTEMGQNLQALVGRFKL